MLLDDPLLSRQADLSEELQARIQETIRPDEQLVWVGRPIAWRRWVFALAPSLAALICFALLFFISGAGQMLENTPPLFVGAFVVLLLLMVALPTGIALSGGGQVLYLLTTKRAVIVRPKWFGLDLSRSYQPHELHGIYCRRVFGGAGDVILERVSGSSTNSHRGFHAIRNPREVQQLIEATLLPTAVGDRVACSPIASGSASFRTTEVRMPTRDMLLLSPTSGTRWFGAAMIVFAMVSLAVDAVLLLSGQFARIGIVNGWPVGGYVVLGIFSIFSLALGLAGLGIVFQPPVRCDQTLRRIEGGWGPMRWLHSWDEVCCVQVIKGKYVRSSSSKGSSRSYQTYELNLVLADGRFTRVNLTCHADEQAIHEDARQLADFLGKPCLDWVTNDEEAEAIAASLRR